LRYLIIKPLKFMKTNVEKTVAAFDMLVGFCNTHGAVYNPSKGSLKMTALNTLLVTAEQTLQAVRNAGTNLTVAINARQQVFNTLPKLGTRIVNALYATDASPELIEDVNRFRHRLRSRVVPGRPPVAVNPVPADPDQKVRGPLAYTDHDSKIATMTLIVQLLASEPSYAPNEADLQVGALKKLMATLNERHEAVMHAQVALTNARMARRAVLSSNEGIHGTALKVKRYIRSVFGATSAQYYQISKLKFRK
jgi:hypothetical protein